MKKTLYLFLIISIFFTSCSNIPDDLYYFDNWKEDKIMLQAELSEDEYMLIYSWIYMLTEAETVKNDIIEGKSYKELYKMFHEGKKRNERNQRIEMEREMNSY